MEQAVGGQVFLGGASGITTWRRDVAIPALEAAGVTYYNPQLGLGEWTEACEDAEMRAKAAAEVLLFVVNGQTRGVATAAEVAYYLAQGRQLALSITDITDADTIDGARLTPSERDDLNRGRIFVRTMAREQGVPVFPTVAEAVQHAIRLVHQSAQPISRDRLAAILSEVRFQSHEFVIVEAAEGFLIQMCGDEECAESGEVQRFLGRPWFISPHASPSDVVRTAMKAALAWQEHEARERFTYRGVPVFGPHGDVEALAAWQRIIRQSRLR